MKAYIGNKVVCLAQPVEKEGQDGYDVLYPDGSETWLVKEIFDFEFRPMDDEEIQVIMSTVIDTELTEEQLRSILEDEYEAEGDIDITGDLDNVVLASQWEDKDA